MDNQNNAVHNEMCQYCKALETVNDPSEGSCPYCAAMNGIPTDAVVDCKYCSAMGDNSSCKYCDAMNSEPAASGCAYCSDMAHRDQECQYCGEAPNTQNPTTTDSQDFAGQGLDAPAIPKPILGEYPQGQISPMDETTNNNLNLDPNGNGEVNVQTSPVGTGDPNLGPVEGVQLDHSKEAMQNIAQQIEGDEGIGSGPGLNGAATALNTDQADLAVGTEMEDNVSRPSGYGQDNDSDMGVGQDPQSDDSPDLTSVLHEGLDAHAENINRERVVQMVSVALTGFKSSKQIIERSQTQAPQLYQASIMMLKAMIEMAKMLGLDQEGAPTNNPLDSSTSSEWSQPFATHPDQGGTPQPGHAPSNASASTQGDANTGNEWSQPFATHPDQGGQLQPGHAEPSGGIGQSIGKLPTSATTPHVARTPLAPGAVNAQGQMKYVDENGKESFIDMKQGRVLGDTGKPVKPSNGG